jgi:hypothetical protein
MNLSKNQKMLLIVLAIIVVIYFLFFKNKDESKKESSFNRKLKERVTPSNAPNCNSGCTLTENKDALGNPADCGNCSSSGDGQGNTTYYTCVCPNGSKHAPYR